MFTPLCFNSMVRPYGNIDLGQGNGLLADSTKPLQGLMLTYHQWGSVAFTKDQFHKCSRYQFIKWVWKYTCKITSTSIRCRQWISKSRPWWSSGLGEDHTVYRMKYSQVLVLFIFRFLDDSRHSFIHIVQGWFTFTGGIIWLFQFCWWNPYWIWLDIDSSNGFLPDGMKVLPEPLLTYHRWGSVTLI